jgi:hypothetical protein
VFLFDPQETKYGKHTIFNIIEIEDYYPDTLGFSLILLNPDEIIENKPLIIDKCNLPIFAYGNKKSRKSRKFKKSRKSRKSKKRKVQKET